jgi:hypothetical protein
MITAHRTMIPSSPLAHRSVYSQHLNFADVASSPEVEIEDDESVANSSAFVNYGIGIYAHGNGIAMLPPSYDIKGDGRPKTSIASHSVALPPLKTNLSRVCKRQSVELVIKNGRATIIASRLNSNLSPHSEKSCASLIQTVTTSDSEDSDVESLGGPPIPLDSNFRDPDVVVNGDALSAFVTVLARSRASGTVRKSTGSYRSFPLISHPQNFLDSFILSKKGEFPMFASPDSSSLNQKRTNAPVQVGHTTPPSSAFSFDDAMAGFTTGMTPYLPTRS